MTINYDDPTPLSELTGEQWREMGFERSVISPPVFRLHFESKRNVIVDLQFASIVTYACDSAGMVLTGITTLGKLRHLIAALS